MPDPATSARRKPGRPGAPLDEARALVLLRGGATLMQTARRLGVHLRRIKPIAEAHGIAFRRVRTGRELRGQDAAIVRMRAQGLSWTQIAAALGYADPATGRIAVRNRALRAGLLAPEARSPRSSRTLLRALRRLGPADAEDVASFVTLAGDPRRHWLLTPQELALARRRRLVPQPPFDR